ncbi:hypothetical protein BCR36DRAFT_409264 [Piromyces finnis]|uniref:Extracellular membrane protein CFEM domain-containing protein n=1 Tax=Piromyces finnis TaxID=1754191 RepID=A0A1Y1VJA5_9FUNG|nr:hypothetical protein BCR36DRAFT_409264 [Piromyces finnis]|eukprot:ORX57793.1 hypothetical protein BCR36DRAFT_409264 [Piromyces finnis]
MKFILKTSNLTLIALIVNINSVNSYAIRNDIHPSLINANQCVKEKNCGNDINCIANCYNVPNPNKESVLRTADCQISCNAKYPDPYLDNELLNQCYQECITKEYYSPNKNNIDQDTLNNDNHYVTNNAIPNSNNISSDSNVSNDEYVNNEPRTDNTSNNNEINNTTNNTSNNGNNLNNTTYDENDNHIYYLEEKSGSKESRIFYSLLFSELILVFTVLYLEL